MRLHPDSLRLVRRSAECFAVLFAVCAMAVTSFAQASPQDQVVQLEHRWLHALNTGEINVIDQILSGDFVRPAPAAGEFITKPELMAYYRSHLSHRPAGPRPQFASLNVRVYGNVAIARGILTTHDAAGHLLRKTLFTDVFIRRLSRWQAISAQENEVRTPAPHNAVKHP